MVTFDLYGLASILVVLADAYLIILILNIMNDVHSHYQIKKSLYHEIKLVMADGTFITYLTFLPICISSLKM